MQPSSKIKICIICCDYLLMLLLKSTTWPGIGPVTRSVSVGNADKPDSFTLCS